MTSINHGPSTVALSALPVNTARVARARWSKDVCVHPCSRTMNNTQVSRMNMVKNLESSEV